MAKRSKRKGSGLSLEGFSSFKRLLDPDRFSVDLKKEVKKATLRNALVIQKTMRDVIRSGVSPENAALTIMIKGSSKPLADRGDLIQSVGHQLIDWKRAFVGVNKKHKRHDIARIVHDGATVPVTPKMRSMFMHLWWASMGKLDPSKLTGRAAEIWRRSRRRRFLPLKQTTSAIIIPPRPFVKMTFENRELREKVLDNWRIAVRTALTKGTRNRGP